MFLIGLSINKLANHTNKISDITKKKKKNEQKQKKTNKHFD